MELLSLWSWEPLQHSPESEQHSAFFSPQEAKKPKEETARIVSKYFILLIIYRCKPSIMPVSGNLANKKLFFLFKNASSYFFMLFTESMGNYPK